MRVVFNIIIIVMSDIGGINIIAIITIVRDGGAVIFESTQSMRVIGIIYKFYTYFYLSKSTKSMRVISLR